MGSRSPESLALEAGIRNTLRVCGNADELSAFQAAIGRRIEFADGTLGPVVLAFGCLLTREGRLDNDHTVFTEAQYAFDGRCDWHNTYAIRDWDEFEEMRAATRWYGIYVTQTQYGDDGIEYGFTTSWSPPFGAILAASIAFPGLAFSLAYESWDELVDIQQSFHCNGGRVVDWSLKCHYLEPEGHRSEAD